VLDRQKFRLKDYATDSETGLNPEDKPLIKKTLQQGVEALAAMQDILYAQDEWSLLVIFPLYSPGQLYGTGCFLCGIDRPCFWHCQRIKCFSVKQNTGKELNIASQPGTHLIF
jgi:hypothetical protein